MLNALYKPLESVNPLCTTMGVVLELKGIARTLMHGFLRCFYPILTSFMVILCKFQVEMTHLCRQWAHDNEELLTQNNIACIFALHHCGLLKYANMEMMKG